jgi:hypothetical protein
MVVQLDKALYGCIQSAKLWYDHFSSSLKRLGFVQNPLDNCVFNLGKGDDQLTVLLHVDDGMATCKDPQRLEDFIANITREYIEVKATRGKKHSFLGAVYDFSTEGGCKVTMPHYVSELLKRFPVQGTSPTPALDDLFTIDVDDEKLTIEEAKRFHSCVAGVRHQSKRS